MASWLYKLRLKDLNKEDADDFTAVAVQNAPEAEKRIRKLMEVVSGETNAQAQVRAEGLYERLDEAADLFEAVKDDDDPLETYNQALELLYDAGDDGHVLWIE